MDRITKVNSTTPWDAKFCRITGYHGKDKDIVTVEYYRAEHAASRLLNASPAACIMEAGKYIEMTKIDKPVKEPKANPPNKDPTLKSARDKSRTDLPAGRDLTKPEKQAIERWKAASKDIDKFPYLSLFNARQKENLPKRATVPVGKVVGSQKELKKKIAEAISTADDNVWTLKTVIQSSSTLVQDETKRRMIQAKIDELGYDPAALTRDNIRELLTMCGMSPDEIQNLEAKIYASPAPSVREFSLDEAMKEAGIDNLDAESDPSPPEQDAAQTSAQPVMNAELDDTAEVKEPKTGQSLEQVATDLKQLSSQSKANFLALDVNQPLKVLYTGRTGQVEVKVLKVQNIVEVRPNVFEIVAKDAADQEVKFSTVLADLRQHKVTNGYYAIKRPKV